MSADPASESMERIQAKALADNMGQYFWPELFKA